MRIKLRDKINDIVGAILGMAFVAVVVGAGIMLLAKIDYFKPDELWSLAHASASSTHLPIGTVIESGGARFVVGGRYLFVTLPDKGTESTEYNLFCNGIDNILESGTFASHTHPFALWKNRDYEFLLVAWPKDRSHDTHSWRISKKKNKKAWKDLFEICEGHAQLLNSELKKLENEIQEQRKKEVAAKSAPPPFPF